MRVLRIIPYNPLQSVWKKSIPVIPVYLPPADPTDDSDSRINNVNDVNKKAVEKKNPLQFFPICVGKE